MATALLLEAPLAFPTVRGTGATVPCSRARDIIRDDLRPEALLVVLPDEYADFTWHVCTCRDCAAYESSLRLRQAA